MRKRALLVTLLLLLLSVRPGWGFDLTILHVNDSHSYLAGTDDAILIDGKKTGVTLGGWARLASAVDMVRSRRGSVALLHGGDAVQGGLYFMKYGGRPEMELLDRLGFDAMTLGNHEFDKGPLFLAGFLKYAGTPILGANVEAPGVPALAKRIRPYVILQYGDERVGVIGLTTPDTAFISEPGPSVRFLDVAETARRCVRELEARGIDKIILLTHIGYENDLRLAAEVPGADVIVGGHSHTLLGREGATDFGVAGLAAEGPYPTPVKGPDGGTVYVVTAWKWSRVLGWLDVSFDGAGRVTAVTARPLLLVGADKLSRKQDGQAVAVDGQAVEAARAWLSAHPPAYPAAREARTAAYLAPYAEGLQAMYREVIGKATADIPHIRVPGRTESGLDLPGGSLLAPLVARSMLERIAETGRPADIALLNAGGVRDSLARGPITVGAVRALMPFGNTLYILGLTGSAFRDALEYGVTRGGGAFPYVAGARYAADMNRPEGSRVTSVEIFSGGAWRPLEPDRTYRVVTNAYLAGGGDGYAMLRSAPDRCDTGFVDALVFMDMVRRIGTLAPPESTGVTYVPGR